MDVVIRPETAAKLRSAIVAVDAALAELVGALRALGIDLYLADHPAGARPAAARNTDDDIVSGNVWPIDASADDDDPPDEW